jgi:hypothetical protein
VTHEDTHALDCETWPIATGRRAPRLVCIAFGATSAAPRLYHRDDWREGWLPEFVDVIRGSKVLVNQNVAFDLAVIMTELRRLNAEHLISDPIFAELARGIWHLYDSDRVRCTLIAAILLSIAKGEPMSQGGRAAQRLHGFGLDDLSATYLNEQVTGKHEPGAWRMRYHELDRVPVSDWPEEAVRYASADPVIADRLFHSLRAFVGGNRPRSEVRNVRASWALMLAEAWGVRTDERYVRALKLHLLREQRDAFATIRRVAGPDGWLRPNGSRDMAKMHERVKSVLVSLGMFDPTMGGDHVSPPTKRHPNGQIKTDRPVLEAIGIADPEIAPDLNAWAAIGATRTDLSTFVPVLERGTALPLHGRWFPCVESERLSCRDPNLTNVPTRSILLDEEGDPLVASLVTELRAKGRPPKVGIRECYVPRPGYLYSACDYSTAELRAFAQIALNWFGRSAMAEALIAEHEAHVRGEAALDLHSLFGARILDVEPTVALRMRVEGDPAFKAVRQLAKRINFGRLGGMGAKRFVLTAQEDKFDLTLNGKLGDDPFAVAERLGAIWFATWPEVPLYFDRIGQFLRQSGGRDFRAVSTNDGLVRGGLGFADGCNHFFQNAVAQWIKDSIYQLAREAYLDTSSAFYGSRVVIIPHDETIAEVPTDRAAAAAERQAEVMRACAQRLCPDIPIEVEPALMHRWHKSAETVRNAEGVLIPWTKI